jgi:hypothetical protein
MTDRVWQPSSCVVCHMLNRKPHLFTTLMRNLDDLSRVNFQCGYCGSIFWWKKETREACGLESRYPLTRSGWNEDIRYIDPKYEDGDVCPRCEADLNYKEIYGSTGKCFVCGGDGIYTKKKADSIL